MEQAVQALNAKVIPSPATLVSYSGHQIRNHGRTVIGLYSNDVQRSVTFELVDESHCPVLGLPACKELDIIKRLDAVSSEDGLKEYEKCFRGIECLSEKHTIRVDSAVCPVVNRERQIHLSMKDKV